MTRLSPPPSSKEAATARARQLARAALILLPALIAVWAIATCALSKGVRETRYGHDVFLPLDAAWRMLSGQTQHADFYSPYGPVEPWLVASMMRLGGVGVLAIPRAVAAAGVVAVVGTLGVVLRRTSVVVGSWLIAVGALIAVGRNQLGFPFFHVSHSAYYNRIGFVLLAAVMIECLVAPRGTHRPAVVIGGALSGFFATLLVFVKLTFPLVAAAFLAMSLGVRPRSRARAAAIACGAIAALAVGGALIGFHYGAMLGDYARVSAARNGFALAHHDFLLDTFTRDSTLITPGRIVETVANDLWPALCVVALAAIVPLDAFRVPERRQVVAVAVVTWAASMMLILTSWQWGESPLYAVLALVLLEHALRSDVGDWRRAACIALSTGCVGSFAVKEVASVLYDEQWQAHYKPAMDTFPAYASAKGLVIDGSDSTCRPREYASRLVAALDVIKTVPDPRIVTLDFSNPFPFLLQTAPATRGGICWHYDSTFSDEVFLSPELMFGDANVVVVPKCPEDPVSGTALTRIYADVLARDFHLIQDTGSLVVLGKGN